LRSTLPRTSAIDGYPSERNWREERPPISLAGTFATGALHARDMRFSMQDKTHAGPSPAIQVKSDPGIMDGHETTQVKAMHLARLALCAVTLLGLSAGYAAAKPVTTAADTNLRTAPGTDSDIVVLIPRGTTIEVDKCTDGWCAVSWDGKDGFAFAGNVLGPTLGEVKPPAKPADVAIDIPPKQPPLLGRPPAFEVPPLPLGADDDVYLKPVRPGYAYRPLPVPYAPPFAAYAPPPFYRW
jgi:hypothetical protein